VTIQFDLGRLQLGQHDLGVTEDHSASRGQRWTAGAAGSIEESGIDHLFERGDLMGHRRLSEAQSGGGFTERALLGHGPQGQEVSDVQIGPHYLMIGDIDH
jgi:hypothetical protein